MRASTATLFLIISVALSSAAQLLFRFVMQQFESSGQGLSSLVTTVSTGLNVVDLTLLATGMVLYAFSMVSWVLALTRYDVSQAYPVMSISYVAVYFGAILLPGLNESISLPSLCGVALIVTGVIFIAHGNKSNNESDEVVSGDKAPQA